MSTEELLAVFEAESTNHKAFEAWVSAIVETEDWAALEGLYARLPEWIGDESTHRLLQVLNQQARVLKDSEAGTQLNFHNAILFWKHFGDERKAEMSFRKMQHAAPQPEVLREFYLSYYTAQGNWRRLEQFLSDPELGGLDSEIEVKRYLGRLAEEKDQPEKAVVFWQGVRRLAPADEEAGSVLGRLYVQVGKWHAMVDLLKDSLSRHDADDVAGKVAILQEMITLYRRELKAPPKVVESYKHLLQLQPENVEAMNALATEYEEMQRWPDLVKVLQQKVAFEADIPQRIALLERIASIMQDRFNNATEAIARYQDILKLEPGHTKAIGALKSLFEERRQWEQYVALCREELKGRDTQEGLQEAILDLARLASERIRRPDVPVELWEDVLAEDADHAEALAALEPLYEREKSFVKLAGVLERRVTHVEEAGERVALLEKLGLLYTSRLADPEGASQVWRKILEADPQHLKAQAELKKKFLAEKDWENLEWYFRTYATPFEWVRTLESQAKQATGEARLTLLFKAATVWKDELHETRRALRNLEHILEDHPGNGEAARLLVAIYRELEMWRKLPDVYEVVLDATDDVAERRTLHLELADLHETRLHASESAFFSYMQAVQESPGETSLHADFRRLAESAGHWESYVSSLEEAVEAVEGRPAKVALLLDMGAVLWEQLESEDAALDAFNRVVELDEGNREALEALEKLYASSGSAEELIAIYERKLQIAESDDERRTTLFALAHAWQVHLQNNEEAESILREMLAAYPAETEIHDRLIGICLAEERFTEISDVLLQKRDVLAAAEVPGPQLADLECELGMLALGTSEDGQGVAAAVGHYAAALSYEAIHAVAIAGLEELVSDEAEQQQICLLLEGVYRQTNASQPLADTLEVQLRHAQAAGDSKRVWKLLTELTALYRDVLSNEDLTWRTHGRRFAERPHDKKVRASFEKLTEERDQWDALVRVYRMHEGDVEEPKARLAINLVVARALHGSLGRSEEALLYFHSVLDDDPAHGESMDALEGIYLHLERYEELLDIYRRKGGFVDAEEEKLGYLYRTADLLIERLDAPENAIEVLREALTLRPGELETHGRLDELLEATEHYEALGHNLVEMIALVQGDLRRELPLKHRLAAVHEGFLEAPEAAIELYAEILDQDADNADALSALERLFEAGDWAVTVAPILEPTFERAGDWARLIDIHRVREQATDDLSEKVAWNVRIAGLFENEGELPESAFQHYLAAATYEPGNETTLAELLRLAELLECWEELVANLQVLVEEIGDEQRRLETHRTIARLALDKTHDVGVADFHLRAILQIDAADLMAVDTLIALYREQESPSLLVDLLLAKATLMPGDAEKRELLWEAAQCCGESLGRSQQAIEIFEGIRDLDPTDLSPLTPLEELYTVVEAWEALVELYRTRIEAAAPGDERNYYAALMGNIQAEQQDDLDAAVSTWRQVLTWDENDVDALERLDDLYQRQGDWFNVLDIVSKLQALAGDEAWIDLQYRVARLHANDDKLGDMHQAIAAYGLLLQRDAVHPQAIDALRVIVAEKDEWEAAFAVLSPILRAQGAFEELWAQHHMVVSHQAGNLAQELATYHAMAHLAEQDLGDADRAFDALAQAFQRDSHHPDTVSELERLAQAETLWESLISLYLAEAETSDDDFHGLALRMKAGAMLMDEVADHARAIQVYVGALEVEPDHREALDRLHRLYRATDNYTELLPILRQQADLHADSSTKMSFLLQLAEVAEHGLDQVETAYDALLETIDLDEGHDGAIEELQRLCEAGVHRLEIAERLERIYQGRGAWERLQGLWELKLEALDDPMDKIHTMRELARLSQEKLESEEGALRWLGEAFRLSPEDEGLLGRLEELATNSGAHDALKATLMDGAAAADDEVRQVELWLKAGAITRDALESSDEAEGIFRLVLDVDEENGTALAALDALYLSQERYEELELVLAKRADVCEYDEERLALFLRLAELYVQLGDRARAIASYRDVLELNDMHGEALEALETIYRDDEAWPELFEVLEQLVNGTTEAEKRAYYTSDMARLAQTELGRVEDAVGLWEDVLMSAPEDSDAVRALQSLLTDLERWNDLSEAFERESRMEHASDERRLDLAKRLGRLWQGQLDDALTAQSHWERARTLVTQSEVEILTSLRDLYRENFVLEPLADVLVEQLGSGLFDAETSLGCWRELAGLRTEALADRPGAIEAWSVVLDEVPTDQDALDNLEQLFEMEGQYGNLVGLYRQKLALLDDVEEQVELRLVIASLEADRLEDSDAASATLAEVLAIDPSNEDAGMRLEQIYEKSEQFEPLAELWVARDDTLEDPEERVENLTRLAKLHEERLEDAGSAFEVLRVAASLLPEDPQLLDGLHRLATLTGQWDEWVSAALQALEVIEEDVALDLTLRVADIQRETLGLMPEAVTSYERALALDEENEKALRALVSLHTELEAWASLVEVLVVLGEVVVNPTERGELYAMAALVHEDQLGDAESAVGAWEMILDADPADATAFENLQRLHREQGAWKELIDVLERSTEADPTKEVAIKLEVAGIYEHSLDAIDEAIEQYEDALTYDPANTVALEALKQIYGEREAWDKLVEVYERSFDACESDDDRIEVCRSIALLYQAVFEDMEGAADAFRRLLDISPGDAEAVEALETILSDAERYEDLVDLYETQLNLTGEGPAKVQLLEKIARVCRGPLEDLDLAIHAYERLLLEEEGHTEGLEALVDMYREQEMWEQAISAQERLARGMTDDTQRLDLQHGVGVIRMTELHDNAGAIECFQAVLAEDPAHADASEALVELFDAEGKHEDIVDILSKRLESTDQPQERAIVHLRLASVLRDKLGQEELALAHLEMSVEACPDADETLWPLAQHYMAGELWTKALPLLDVLVDRLADTEGDPRLGKVQKDIARCAEALYDSDRSIGAFRAALALDPDDMECVHGLARTNFREEAWDASLAYYERLVEEVGGDFDDDTLAGIYFNMGEAAFHLEDVERACEHYERCLDHRPQERKALERVINVIEARGEWEAAISRKRDLMPLLEEDLHRFTLNLSIGDLYREKLSDLPSAMDAYQEALHFGAFSKTPLLQLLQIFSDQSNYEEAIVVLDKLIGLEDEDDKIARWAWTAAVMCRDELGDETRTVTYLNKVLDHDISKLEAFRAIDEALTAQRAWKPLEQNYRKMLQRVQKAGDAVENRGALLYTIYKNLGEIYRSRLENTEYAISAFELAAQQRPQDVRMREILTELFEVDDGTLDKAITQLRILLKLQPDVRANYERLYHLYERQNDADACWRTAGLITFLGRPTDAIAAVYAEGMAHGLIDSDQHVSEKQFLESLLSPGQDRYLGELFHALYQVAAPILVQRTPKDFNLKKKDLLDLSEPRLITSTLKAVAQVLGLTLPDIYLSPSATGLEILPTSPPTLQVGADLLQGKSEKELSFIVGQKLAYLHRHHLMAAHFGPQELESFFVVTRALCEPGFTMASVLGDDASAELLQSLEDLKEGFAESATPKQLALLTQVFEAYAKQPRAQSVALWLKEVELSANHAAILVTDDVALSGTLLQAQEDAGSPLSAAERLKDLVLFATSGRYATLRKGLGIDLESSS